MESILKMVKIKRPNFFESPKNSSVWAEVRGYHHDSTRERERDDKIFTFNRTEMRGMMTQL